MSDFEIVPQTPGAQPVHAANAALEAWAKANVAARFALAVQRPRDPDVARERLLKECRRPNFCEVARWTIPNRGSGYSIRFAETALRLWGNVGIDPLLVYEDDDRRVLNLTVTDYEANLTYSRAITVPKTVERKHLKPGQVVRGTRKNTSGETLYIVEATEQEIAQRQGAEVSKAIRAEGLRLIPGDLLDEASNQLRTTLREGEAKDPDAARRRILDSFASLNVSAGELKRFLGKELGQCTPAELADLRELWTALKEGHTTWTDVTWQGEEAQETPRKPPARGTAAVLDRLKAREAAENGPGIDAEPEVATDSRPENSVDPGASQGPSRGSTQPAPTLRNPLGNDLASHQEDAAAVCKAMGLEPWQRWTAGRSLAVAKAMKDAGIDSPSQFWAAVGDFGSNLSEAEYADMAGLEDLLSSFGAATVERE